MKVNWSRVYFVFLLFLLVVILIAIAVSKSYGQRTIYDFNKGTWLKVNSQNYTFEADSMTIEFTFKAKNPDKLSLIVYYDSQTYFNEFNVKPNSCNKLTTGVYEMYLEPNLQFLDQEKDFVYCLISPEMVYLTDSTGVLFRVKYVKNSDYLTTLRKYSKQ